jgi:hypothetical protein
MRLRNFKFDQNLTRIKKKGNLHEDRYVYIYDISLEFTYNKPF